MPLSGAHSLPEDLYSADAVREIDRYVIDQQGVDGFDLMQAAAAGVAGFIEAFGLVTG